MAVALEFIDFLVPISVIRKKYPGGWEQCLKDYGGYGAAWHDEYLFRYGAMSGMAMEAIVNEWKKMGFKPTGKKNGQTVWKDCCVAESFPCAGATLPCDWLVVDGETRSAYLKGTEPGIIYGPWPYKLCMIGAMIGDIAGSGYEHKNIKHKPDVLMRDRDHFTDDTVLTYAVAMGILNGMKKIDRASWMADTAMQDIVEKEIALSVKQFARKYPGAGYGHKFKEWVKSNSLKPYGSYGNGSAMRVSFAGWYANSLEEAQLLAKLSAQITHNHEDGIKGAVAVAGCIYLLRTGRSKDDVREYVKQYYNIGFTLDEIRDFYAFDSSCEGSVPQAIAAFFENDNFEDVIKAAISIGGDSDTIAAIAGSIAEPLYPVPGKLTNGMMLKLDSALEFALKTVIESLPADCRVRLYGTEA
ncbi:hypothetical protein AGMMS50276_04120 [Synergistales bacterium]|nr:hypothetical protein AGMMS50276_04120 [Synergistales bacterium]